jgi:hypothetical protein
VNTSYLNFSNGENTDSIEGDDRSSSVSKEQKSEKALALKKHLLEKNQDMIHQSVNKKMNQSQIAGYRKTKINSNSGSMN